MKKTMDEIGNGPVEKEENEAEMNYEEDVEEEYDHEEFMKLNAELDALHSALDSLEQRNDSICDRLRKILAENQAMRQEMEGRKEESCRESGQEGEEQRQ